MAKCLVTGGAGFIGSHVVELLLKNGHEVAVLDDLSTGKTENLKHRARLYVGSVTRPAAIGKVIENLEGVDYVFHLAALARIQPSIDKPVRSHKVNLDGTLNILEVCRKHNAKIIFSSSSSIYEGSDLPTKEDSPIDPKNPYALQKWLSEQYIELYAKLYDLDYTILRYFNVFGERQILTGSYAAVVGIFLQQKENGNVLTITNDGEQKRDFTYVKDVARANVMAMEWPGDVFNIGTGVNYTINEIADFVGGHKDYIGERIGEVRETLADNSHAYNYGWMPEVNIKDWVNENIG